jgi:hypothetical protein
MRYRIALVIVLLGLMGASYAFWAYQRFNPPIGAWDPAWPRAFPYPDTSLMALHDFYDRRHPVFGGIKSEGERLRVNVTLLLGIGAFAAIAAAGALPFATRWWRLRRSRSPGFEVITKDESER